MKYNKTKLVLFDLDGVFFTGSVNGFNEKLQKELNFSIPLTENHCVVLDEELNCSKKDIIQFLNEVRNEQNLSKLTKAEMIVAKDLWMNNWKPDKRMENILRNLQQKCDLGVLSNVDFLNGENYKAKGFFRYFSDEHLYLSYEMNCLKPDKEIFRQVTQKTGYYPEEITFIDNSEVNVVAAKDFGLNTFLYSNKDDYNIINLQKCLLQLFEDSP